MPGDGTRFDSWRSPNRGATRRAHGGRARDARFADDTGSRCGPNRSFAGGQRANRARTVSPRLPPLSDVRAPPLWSAATDFTTFHRRFTWVVWGGGGVG